jgi:hypothetical protein
VGQTGQQERQCGANQHSLKMSHLCHIIPASRSSASYVLYRRCRRAWKPM